MNAAVVVLDLDDTLYLERDYVASGFAAVGEHLARLGYPRDFAAVAWRLFGTGRRGDVFDAALAELGCPATPHLIESLVTVYRRHQPQIALAPDAAAFLDRTVLGYKLALITDGFLIAQQNKIAALGLARWPFRPLLCTDALGRACWKPSPVAFEAVAAAHKSPPQAMVYIADNATKDFAAPRRLGWRTVQIERPGGLHLLPPPGAGHHADLRITSFAELTPDRLDALIGNVHPALP